MGKLGRRLERYEGDEQDRARREVHRRLAGISDERLLKLTAGVGLGDPSIIPPPEEFGLTRDLIHAATGNPSDDDEGARRLDRLLQPLWRRLDALRSQSKQP